jgi:hypothetical protein
MKGMSKDPISIRIKIPGRLDAVIAPGDSLDVGPYGVLVWYHDEDAEAYRLSETKRHREFRAVLERRGSTETS